MCSGDLHWCGVRTSNPGVSRGTGVRFSLLSAILSFIFFPLRYPLLLYSFYNFQPILGLTLQKPSDSAAKIGAQNWPLNQNSSECFWEMKILRFCPDLSLLHSLVMSNVLWTIIFGNCSCSSQFMIGIYLDCFLTTDPGSGLATLSF